MQRLTYKRESSKGTHCLPWPPWAALNGELKRKKKKKQNRLFTGKQEQKKVEKEVASAFKIQLPHYRTDEAPLSPNTSYRYQVIQELATTVKFFSVLPF